MVHRRLGTQRCKMHRVVAARLVAVGVIIELAGLAVVDDAVVLVVRLGGPGLHIELALFELAAELIEDRIVEREDVGVVTEVGNGVEIARAQLGLEYETVAAVAAGEDVLARAPDERVVAVAALDCIVAALAVDLVFLTGRALAVELAGAGVDAVRLVVAGNRVAHDVADSDR